MSSRREKIEQMLQDEPQDIFLRYSLALELFKEERSDEGLQLLSELAGEQPAYVPAFFMSGQHLAKLGRIPDARTALREGIEAARSQENSHAAAEMSEFLASLGAS